MNIIFLTHNKDLFLNYYEYLIKFQTLQNNASSNYSHETLNTTVSDIQHHQDYWQNARISSSLTTPD